MEASLSGEALEVRNTARRRDDSRNRPAAERNVARGATLFTVALGAIVLLAWALDLEGLKSVGFGSATMKANTALGFLLGGIVLWLACERGRRDPFVPWLAGAVALLGLATVVEFATGLDFGIDQALFPDPGAAPGSPPGRMSAITALSFLLFGVAAIAGRGSARATTTVFTTLCLGGFVLSYLAVVGYAFETPDLIRPVAEASIAFHTAIGFLVLLTGLMATRPDLGLAAVLLERSGGGTLARWVLPVLLVVTPLLVWVILHFQLVGLYGPHLGSALFAVAYVVILTGVMWAASRHATELDRARHQQERLSQAIVENALSTFILMDADGHIIEWNPQAERTFGWSREEALGRRVAETIVPPARRDAHEKGLARFVATGEGPFLSRRNEVVARRRDGSEFPAELIVTPVRLNGGWVFSGYLRDLSEQKQIEASLRQSQKMEAVGQLTGGVAHDFNNLLTVVIGSLDMALDKAEDELRVNIDAALRAAERGASLTQRLLAYSRQQTLDPVRIDINDMVEDMRELLSRTLGETIEIEHRTADGLWPAFADPGQVENALLNLAVNARDAMPEGGRLTIETGNIHLDDAYAARNLEVTPGDYVMLAVSDTGTGMPPEVVERAFEPFFTTKAVGKGTGLGLSMIFGFAKQSGGHLKIYSEQGFGTTVRLYLPRADEAADAVAEQAGFDERRPDGEVILVVEDDPEVRALAVKQLRELGYRVLEAVDGPSAKAILDNTATRIDLLFTDVVMPGGMTGRQLAEAVAEVRPDLRTLFTSGYTQNSIVHHGRLDAGVNFLSKPYRRSDLAEKIRAALDGPD